MQFTVVGCWAPYPRIGEACSGYLVQEGDTALLLDCGHGVFSSLGRYIDYNFLTGVFISHFHPDHYVDLYALRHALRGAFMLKRRIEKLKVFMPDEPHREYAYFKQVPEFEVIKVENGLKCRLGSIDLEFFSTRHALPAYGLLAESKGKKVFYTGDTSLFPGLYQGKEGIDLLVAECTLFKGETSYAAQTGHMTTCDVALLAEHLKARRLLATHFWPEYQIEKLKGEIEEGYKGSLFMAQAGFKIEI
ncbi:Ribonuclease BN, tRNA processing enzyme [Thermosyntropha lipolytica DSM 11003]|uniref:Ribonuclease BN, tRNA processing enzyme n=1 Tax=Thermosyntropha lipolytica DSM 11003 TaxID=1123382 RepID=A0A1M5MSX8_9FIRM|nr:MBL fold metallo-hydrolase [Thermosyntropha lipolytica]SHG80317.1 Ribonuclease BN, tRNA processing enzyme [Thermosyntropha lipolytica DSM 11003]